jgi:hypothetical protein
MSDAARLLDVLAAAAQRGDDLAAALRGSGLPGAATAAARLEQGAALPEAVAGLVPPATAELLGGSIPPLATVATLLADEAWRAAERRRLLWGHLSYPLAAGLIVAIGAVVLAAVLPAGRWYTAQVSPVWAVPPLLAALLLTVAPWLPRDWHLPGSGWARHLDLAARWARAGLAARWRLSEAQAQRLLGVDLAPMAALLGLPDAAAHCRMLAEWHRRAAWRRLGLTARCAAALLLLAGGGVVLASARLWSGA